MLVSGVGSWSDLTMTVEIRSEVDTQPNSSLSTAAARNLAVNRRLSELPQLRGFDDSDVLEAVAHRECSKRGIYPPSMDFLERNVPSWRGVPMLPCSKIPVEIGHFSS